MPIKCESHRAPVLVLPGIWAAFVVGAVEEQTPSELEAYIATLSLCFPPGISFSEARVHACQLLINIAAF